MNSTLIGGCGFLGTNLAAALAARSGSRKGGAPDVITVVDRKEEYFQHILEMGLSGVRFLEGDFRPDTDFDRQVKGADVVYHLACTTIPGTSNQNIPEELEANVIPTARLLDACVRQHVGRVVFLSSGGAVYGKKGACPVREDMVTYPISSYGIQKVTIEKLLYLYRYQEGLDYRVIRLANPYGPYQRPNGRLGVVTTFIYRALTDHHLEVYGDGSVIRDFLYIDDAVRGILNIVDGENDLRVFNLGSGHGTSVAEVIEAVRRTVYPDLTVDYIAGRPTDVPANYLDISRYESIYGCLHPISLEEGIRRTASFLEGKIRNSFQ